MRESDSNSEFNRLSCEAESKFCQEMGELLSSVSSQIQRAINEAINNQILPQIQATLRSDQGQMPERRWEIPAGRQGFSSEEAIDSRFRSSSRDECNRNFNGNENLNNTCDRLCRHRILDKSL